MSAEAVQTLRTELRPILVRMSTDQRAAYVQQVRESQQMPWWALDAAIDLAYEVGIVRALKQAPR